MDEAPDSSKTIPFHDLDGPWGMLDTGTVPVDGFEIRRDLRVHPLEQASGTTPSDEWLVAKSSAVRRYATSRHRDRLLRDFEALGPGAASDAILAMANRYGWLTNPVALVAAPGLPALAGGIVLGEGLDTWREHLAAFCDLRRTWRQVEILLKSEFYGPSEKRAARAYLTERIEWSGSGVLYRSGVPEAGWEVTRWIAATRDLDGDLAGRFNRSDPVGPAHFYVHREVNHQLRGHVSPAVPAFVTTPVMRLAPDSLAAAIYFQFALALVSPGAREQVCPGCSRPFAQTRRNRKYCGKNCRERVGYHRRAEWPASVRGPSERVTLPPTPPR